MAGTRTGTRTRTRAATGAERGTVRLGRIAGIPVAAHWSVLGIVALIAVVMARSELPLLAPGHGALAYGVAGLAVALLLMASLLAHEAAHAVVSRAHGLGVDSITLWLLGGTTRLRGEPSRPGVELRVAVVGPLVSGALAGLFALAGGWARALPTDLVAAVLVELAVINLVLAVFNLLPAAPLDGGRVLRAILWSVRGDRWAAARTAARVGQVLGFGLVAGGVFLAFAVGLGGLWLVILGWFIATAAGAEERLARQGRALDGVPVAAAAGTAPPVLPADTGPAELAAAAADPRARRAGLLLVAPDGRPSSYLPPDAVRVAATSSGDPAALRGLGVPASRLTTARPEDPLSPLIGRLGEPGARVVVVDGDTPVGLVSATDVERLLRGVTAPGGRPGARPPDGAAVGGPDGRPESVPDPDAPPPPGWWWHGGPPPRPST